MSSLCRARPALQRCSSLSPRLYFLSSSSSGDDGWTTLLSPRHLQPPSSRRSMQSNRVEAGRPHTSIKGYYIAYPDIPDATPDNNRFVAAMNRHDWPPFASIGHGECYDGAIRMLLDMGATYVDHNDLMKDQTLEKTFATVLEPFLEEERNARYAVHCLQQRMAVDWWDDDIKRHKADCVEVGKAWDRNYFTKFMGVDLYKALREVYADRANLSLWQLKLVEFYMRNLKAYGADFETEDLHASLNRTVRDLNWVHRQKYILNLIESYWDKRIKIPKENVPVLLADAPPHVLALLKSTADDGSVSVRLIPTLYFPFMSYCKERSMRFDAFNHWCARSGFKFASNNNSVLIEEIRASLEHMARLIGYECTSDKVLHYNMAGSTETVTNFLTALKSRMKPAMAERLVEMQQYAKQTDMIGDNLKMWDMAYYCRKEAESQMSILPLDLQQFFPFWPTFDNILRLFSDYFGLQFKDITDTSKLERCHDSVRIFAVSDTDSGEHLGRVIVDPFLRPLKHRQWTTKLARTSKPDRGEDKIVFLNGCVVRAGDEDAPYLLHYEPLQRLLGEIGRTVELMLSRSPYEDLIEPNVGAVIVDGDARDAFACFARMLVHRPAALDAISPGHFVSGERLTPTQLSSIGTAIARSTLWDSCRALFWSDFDHTIFRMKSWRQKFWVDVYKELWTEHFPIKMYDHDFQPCSFTPLFLTPLSGNYYSQLWAEMLALDMHSAFDADANPALTGRRLKQAMLIPAGTERLSELFRRFRGRDPSTEPICDFYDPPVEGALLEEGNNDDNNKTSSY